MSLNSIGDLYRKLVAFNGMTLMGLTMVGIRVLTLDRGIEFNRQFVAPFFCRLMLRLVGVQVDNQINVQKRCQVIMFNHNSFLDIFIIPMLGLKNTRYIISEDTKKILPLHLCNLGIGALYIPVQTDTSRRLAFFKRVSEDLRQQKYSVICAPEGQHTFRHWIGPFNKGVFHMASAAKAPIQTMFIDIPKKANPLESLRMKPCTVRVKNHDLIPTTHWRSEQLQQNIEQSRNRFIDYYKHTHGGIDETLCYQ